MRTWNRKASSIFLGLAMAVGGISLISSGDAYASGIQTQPPEKIFAASCSTCHGGLGKGGVTWVRDADEALGEREAPAISGVDFNRDGVINVTDINYIKMKVRNGSNNGAMPAFGKEEIGDTELGNLASALIASTSDALRTTNLVPAVLSNTVRLDILDADPWFWERDGVDGNADDRRVVLTGTQALKVVNTGRTWHTLTDKANGKDSGFIGYAGNHHNTPGDLDQGVAAGIGYYYAAQGTDLTPGCERYLCKMHPYMQVEVCTTGFTPAGPTAALGLTRAHKHPFNPTMTGVTPGQGEVWVTTQSQDLSGEDTVGLDPGNDRSVIGMDGTYQVINAGTWVASFVRDANNNIANVGNNPHNAWPGKDGANNDVVLSANWHDNTISLMDATNKKILMERRSGSTNAHVITMPAGSHDGSFFISHMGGRAIQEVSVDDLRLGNDPNIPGRLIRGNTGPHGLWTCGDGTHIMTADTFGGSATWYNIDTKKRSTASSGGAAPLAPAIFSATSTSPCITTFTNNATTAGGGDVSVYNIGGTDNNIITNDAGASWAAGGTLFKNPLNNNIDLRVVPGDTNYTDMALSPIVAETINQARWVHLPIQTPVSPAAGTGEVLTHGRYIVTANKASFNVSVTKLNPTSGMPTDTYTFPAGLGAHGVTYGKKSSCSNPSGILGGNTCYYAYVTNTLEDYVSVYDLEQMETGGAMLAPGSALIAERVYVEGGAVAAVAALDAAVPTLLCDGLGGPVKVDEVLGLGIDINGDGIVSGDGISGNGDEVWVLDCGVGAMGGGALYVSNLPIGVLCPDCRSGVHVGDIPLTLTTGAPLASQGDPTSAVDVLTNTGASPTDPSPGSTKYTYLKEPVWVDTETVACVLVTLDTLTGFAGGVLVGANDCISGTADIAGTLNLDVSAVKELDLDLGINTGGQGIVARGSNGLSPAPPWTP